MSRQLSLLQLINFQRMAAGSTEPTSRPGLLLTASQSSANGLATEEEAQQSAARLKKQLEDNAVRRGYRENYSTEAYDNYSAYGRVSFRMNFVEDNGD